MMNRRSFLTSAAASTLALLATPAMAGVSIGPTRKPEECWAPPVPEKPRKPQVAASLGRLLNTGRSTNVNMTRIDGYVLDNDGDVILWGRNEKGQAEVMLDDLVVAIRSVYGLYGSSPGVSLDPDPWGNVAFHEYIREHHGRQRGQEYNDVCKNIGSIPRIEGMPKNAQAPKTLLIADRCMKLTGVGRYKLKIKNPFPSTVDRYHEAIKLSVKNQTPFKYPGGGGRYWFEPAKLSYLQDGRTGRNIFFDCVQVVLRDERMSAVPSQDDVGVKNNPFATAFTCDWTNRMDEVVRSEVMWMDMYNIFRHFALARVLYDKGALANMDQDMMLDRYQITHVSMPIEFERPLTQIEWSFNGKNYHDAWCGGVSPSGPVTQSTNDDMIADVKRAGEIALASRGVCTDACWNVE